MENERKKRSQQMKLFIPLTIVVVAVAIFLYIKVTDNPSKSKVDGVSDEVYEELVQWYFYTVIFMNQFMDSHDHGKKIDAMWFEDHELYNEAEEYASSHDDVPRPIDVFPNPLLYKYSRQLDKYTDTEQQYIEKILSFYSAFQRLNLEEYEPLKEELKEDLHIKDSYNPFD